MTGYRQSIRVIYPQNGGRIALRTDENWNADVEAVRRNGYTTEFQVETERPYFYFKPVLRRDGATMWSRGENCLAIATSEASLEVHPFFREDTQCSVCELMPPLASPSGIEHRFRVFLPPRLPREYAEAVSGPLHARRAQPVLQGRSVRRKHMAY